MSVYSENVHSKSVFSWIGLFGKCYQTVIRNSCFTDVNTRFLEQVFLSEALPFRRKYKVVLSNKRNVTTVKELVICNCCSDYFVCLSDFKLISLLALAVCKVGSKFWVGII